MKASSKLLIAASLLAASSFASAEIVTVTFDFNSSGFAAAAPGSNLATPPNITGITGGYFDATATTYLTAGASVGYYSGGFGVYSPNPFTPNICSSNTNTYPKYSDCKSKPDEHFIDNNDNTSRYKKKESSTSDKVSYNLVNAYDDFARFAFDANVLVTSITLTLFDTNRIESGCSGPLDRNGKCDEDDRIYNYWIDVMFNTQDDLTGPWSAMKVDLGSGDNAPSTFTINTLGLYTPNDYFYFGAGFGKDGTGFKIKSLTVDMATTEPPPEGLDCNVAPTLPQCSNNTVPEPGTLSSLGLAAIAMAAVGRLRRRRTS